MKTRIKEICKEKGMTISTIAELIGTPQTSLSRALSENGNPTLETLSKIAGALGVPVADLFEQPAGDTITCPKCGTKFRMEE
ncbi:MAG: helix-turn-helix domain-containing protein [Tannerellaceae bacterium]|jgi:transcriptional regulator with XRE-family HTH domain|nr:helix-turn-helix domain-containing protein [Tannerellaceae bacterium]